MRAPRPDTSLTPWLLRQPAVRELRVAGSPLASVLDNQLRFALARTPGAAGTWVLAPESSGAAAALQAPGGDRLERILLGTVKAVDARRPSSVTHISLATGDTGFAANLLADRLAANPGEVQRLAQADPREGVNMLEQMLSRNAPVSNRAEGVHDSGRLSLSWPTSYQLLLAAADPASAASIATQHAQYVLAHELEHTVTPRQGADTGRLDWLEEATAEVLTLNRRSATERSRAAGISPTDASASYREWLRAYAERHDTLTTLLDAAGIATSTSRGLAAASKLLQGAPIGQVPARLARAIGANRGLSASETQGVQQAIESGDGTARFAQEIARRIAPRARTSARKGS